MSPTRDRQLLGGTDRLGEDALAELGAKAAPGDEIDLASQEGLQTILQVEELEEPSRPIELHQEIDVAAGTCLIACDRAEDGERRDPECA